MILSTKKLKNHKECKCVTVVVACTLKPFHLSLKIVQIEF